MYHCSKCGRSIKNVFKYNGNIYGSECINTIPINELSVLSDEIDVNSIIIGLEYCKIKDVDLNDIISKIPKINSVITEQTHNITILGYSKHKRKIKGRVLRKKEEFAIRIKTTFKYTPQFNSEGWLYIDSLI